MTELLETHFSLTRQYPLTLKIKDLELQNKARTANSTFAIGGVSSPLDSLVVAESSVLRTNFCGKSPAHRQSAKR